MRALHLLFLLVVSACTQDAPKSAFLVFQETEPGGNSYPVRMLITDRYLRIEDGDGKSGFILFDRGARKIYSVNTDAGSTMILEGAPVKNTPPKKFEHRVETLPESLPDVGGHSVVHHRLLTNNEKCFDVYAAKGLLPQAVQALREYHQALAAEQAALQSAVPAEFQSVCDLADYVFVPARYLDQGFPVRQVNRAGVMRQLVDFKVGVPVDEKLLQLPTGFSEVIPSKMRGQR